MTGQSNNSFLDRIYNSLPVIRPVSFCPVTSNFTGAVSEVVRGLFQSVNVKQLNIQTSVSNIALNRRAAGGYKPSSQLLCKLNILNVSLDLCAIHKQPKSAH